MHTKLREIRSSLDEHNDYLTCFFENEIESKLQRDAQVKLSQYYNRVLGQPENYNEAPDDLSELFQIRKVEDAWIKFEEHRIKDAYIPENYYEFADWYQKVNQQRS